jgi:hypothetical protein
MRRIEPILLALSTGLLAAAAPAVADDPMAGPPSAPAPAKAPAADAPKPTAAPGSDADALRGPSVKTTDRPEPTIVERDFDGRLKRPAEGPALAALDRLGLDAPARAKVDEALQERNRIIDGLVRENLLDLAALANARASGDKAETKRLLGALLEKAKPVLARGSLADEIRRALPADTGAKYGRMVAEYRRAAMVERKSGPGEDGQTPGTLAAVLQENLQDFGAEVKRSYDRTYGAAGKDFDKLIKDLALTPEQESRVRQKVQAAFERSRGKMTEAAKAKLFLEVYAELDENQRKQLAERIGQERRDEARLRRRK